MSDKSKSLKDFLSKSYQSKEVYLSDQMKRNKRQSRGLFSKNSDCFDFIHLINNWSNIVGDLLGQNTIAQKIKNGTLYVIAKHPVFAQEIDAMSPQIIKKIEAFNPELKGTIKKIKFTHSNFSWEEFVKENKIMPVKKKLDSKNHPFSPEYRLKLAKAKELFSDIDDEEIKELLTSLFLKRF